jgi:hypothetical protein
MIPVLSQPPRQRFGQQPRRVEHLRHANPVKRPETFRIETPAEKRMDKGTKTPLRRTRRGQASVQRIEGVCRLGQVLESSPVQHFLRLKIVVDGRYIRTGLAADLGMGRIPETFLAKNPARFRKDSLFRVVPAPSVAHLVILHAS